MEPSDLIKALRETDKYIEMIYLNGGCYAFYQFLKTIYPEAKPYMTTSRNHVVTKIYNAFYDITGKVKGDFQPLSRQDIDMCKKWRFARNNWLYRECPNCEEPIMA